MNRFYAVGFLAVLPVLHAPNVLAQDRGGFAVNGGIGSSNVRDKDATESFQGSAFAWNLGVEYRFNRTFALGFGTFNLGKPTDTLSGVETEFDVRGIEVLARLYFPLTDKIEIFGLVGNANYYVDIEPGGNNGLFGEEAWEYGAGIDFDVTDDFSWRLEGRYYDGPRAESANLVTLGFTYRF